MWIGTPGVTKEVDYWVRAQGRVRVVEVTSEDHCSRALPLKGEVSDVVWLEVSYGIKRTFFF